MFKGSSMDKWVRDATKIRNSMSNYWNALYTIFFGGKLVILEDREWFKGTYW